ncbi:MULTISPECIES: LysR family transcriptional regulator [Rhizobium]|uniref:LysR family transcriptional regulator n=1 Tax=Rhizobium TaxID=379 RepID=UPI0013DD889C|nr:MULTISPECIES: LysR family transcriptional regulator [Rhizobium]MBB4299514.1 DNA-binding transcriptional LysR family regulator [Rhizobium leguminosarum]MBB4310952.1 DNA-binding transcriptional LysR family regulator [Rhizobium leguminosarum]MBB4419936.1 DNA-binding transcriptional LysR family regulator [Rhizobium leguminosarum]MBB4435068.1 DNA-binding transcriptional LysR family regulator [Rhizobium esperanzae]MBB4532000.1 DNA-binding transcriptional LysR family regulator [Rhizobium leguminos
MRVSLRHFRFFVAVAETGQVSKAAAALFTSQPSVTEAIKTLESDMGVKLFDRSSKGVTLTYEGGIFLQHARNVLAAAVNAMLAPQLVQRDMAGELTLACTHTVTGYFATPLLSRFRRIFPEIKVNLVEFKRAEIERRILEGDIDLAICLLSPLESGDQIETELLVRSKRRLWLPANHGLLDNKSISLRDVQMERYIMLAIDDAEETTLAYFRDAGLEPNVVFRTTSMEAIRNLVAEGFGVTILSDMVYRPWSLDGVRLAAASISGEVPSMDIGLAWSRNSGLSRDAKLFVDVCRSGSGVLAGTVYDEPL